MLGWLFGSRRRRERRRELADAYRRRLEARYDAARTTVDNERHWSNADQLGPRAAADPAVRQTLRSRSRYECVESNSYGRGIIQTLANDCVGDGPRLALLGDPQRELERAWNEWAEEVDLAAMLRTARQAKAVDGEVFVRLRTRRGLESPVKLWLEVLEADHVDDTFAPRATPGQTEQGRRIWDGIEYGSDGRPLAYYVHPHPGELLDPGEQYGDPERVPATEMIHWYRQDRPGQVRGIPETASALPLFAQLRRYTLAVLAAAETAADHAGVMHTDQPIDVLQEVNTDDWFTTHEIERRALLTLPEGWKMTQLRAEQPSTTYSEFKRELLGEIGRAFGMPVAVVTGDSSEHNYASGRLDYQIYRVNIGIERKQCATVLLNRVFVAWLREYLAWRSGLAPMDLSAQIVRGEYARQWDWPPFPYVDPSKEAKAYAELWQLGLLTDDEFYRTRGLDPAEQYDRLERQIATRRRIGAPLPGVTNLQQTAGDQAEETDE